MYGKRKKEGIWKRDEVKLRERKGRKEKGTRRKRKRREKKRVVERKRARDVVWIKMS